jgi:Protein of unknown function (DUF3099)
VVSKRRPGSPTRGRSRTDRVHTITSTQGPLGEDIDRRARRYLVQMGIRTVCFLGAVFTWGRVPTWLSVVMLVSAVVLPYVAVVLANAGRERPEHADSFLDLREIGAAPLHPPVGPTAPVPPRGPGSEPFGGQPSGGQPFTGQPFTAGPFAGEPFTDDPFTTPVPGPTGPDGPRRD